jgi:hypothetical protein
VSGTFSAGSPQRSGSTEAGSVAARLILSTQTAKELSKCIASKCGYAQLDAPLHRCVGRTGDSMCCWPH